MAIREIRVVGDDILTKKCKEVKMITPRTETLIFDMLDTMYEEMGVGLAAPQVGILKRIVVIDIGEGPIIMINPEILETSGEQTGEEGCLSLPGKAMQKLTTKEPDDDMIEVAIAAVEAVFDWKAFLGYPAEEVQDVEIPNLASDTEEVEVPSLDSTLYGSAEEMED